MLKACWSREVSIKLRDHCFAQTVKIHKTEKEMNVPRDTVGKIVCKFKVEGTVIILEKRRKLSITGL